MILQRYLVLCDRLLNQKGLLQDIVYVRYEEIFTPESRHAAEGAKYLYTANGDNRVGKRAKSNGVPSQLWELARWFYTKAKINGVISF